MDNKLDVDFFYNRLTQMQEQLGAMNQSSQPGTETVELDQSRMGRLTRIDAIQQQAMSVQAEQRRKHQLRKIDSALEKIKRGDYGECEHCLAPIPHKRLEFDPCATLCVACAAKLE